MQSTNRSQLTSRWTLGRVHFRSAPTFTSSLVIGAWVLAGFVFGIVLHQRLPARYQSEWIVRGLPSSPIRSVDWEGTVAGAMNAAEHLDELEWDWRLGLGSSSEYRLHVAYATSQPQQSSDALSSLITNLGSTLANESALYFPAPSPFPANTEANAQAILHAMAEETATDSEHGHAIQPVLYLDSNETGNVLRPGEPSPLQLDQQRLQEMERELAVLRDRAGGVDAATASAEATLRKQLVELEARRALLAAVMTPKHPTMMTLHRTIESTRIQWEFERDRLKTAEHLAIERLERRIAVLRSRIDLEQGRAERLKGDPARMKTRSIPTPVPSTTEVIEIEQVVPPTADRSMWVPIILGSSFLGFLIGLAICLLGLATLRKGTRTSVEKPTEIPVLGHIPRGGGAPPVSFRRIDPPSRT